MSREKQLKWVCGDYPGGYIVYLEKGSEHVPGWWDRAVYAHNRETGERVAAALNAQDGIPERSPPSSLVAAARVLLDRFPKGHFEPLGDWDLVEVYARDIKTLLRAQRHFGTD